MKPLGWLWVAVLVFHSIVLYGRTGTPYTTDTLINVVFILLSVYFIFDNWKSEETKVMHVLIDYNNHAGVRSTRKILPISIRFAATEWHREPQWLLLARDLDKGANREFAISEIHQWIPTS